jgi:hypothetical protein
MRRPGNPGEKLGGGEYLFFGACVEGELRDELERRKPAPGHRLSDELAFLKTPTFGISKREVYSCQPQYGACARSLAATRNSLW